MAVVLREQLELRPSVALQKKVGLKSVEQVIHWGDRVNQELRRLRKLEDRKCWRARARRIRKKSRGGSSGLSKAQALVEIEQQERGYQKEVAKVRKWWLEALEEVEKIVQPEEKLIVWSAEDQEQRRRARNGSETEALARPTALGCATDNCYEWPNSRSTTCHTA